MKKKYQTPNEMRLLTAAFCAILTIVVPMTNSVAQQEELTDSTIRDAVEDEILFDPAVSLNNIDVAVQNGIVTLTGSVNNLLAQQRAIQLAETVRGVRSVIDRVEVDAEDRPDSDIESDVREALLQNPATETYEVQVSVDDGTVTLTGTVESWQEKNLAERVAKGVRGVSEIENNIRIDYESERPDYEIQKEIQQALRWNELVDDELIVVSVEDGAVELTGTVGSAAEKRQARYSSWVAGVESVDASGLEVSEWAREEKLRKTKYAAKTDEEIQEAIEDALLFDPRVYSFNITPTVSAGEVTLRGTVNNLKAKRAAAKDARNTVGVVDVVNRIRVRTDEQLSDTEIAEDVRAALQRDPYVERLEINVNVVDGVAYLNGRVDSYFEKAQADDIAATVEGVVEVENNLTIDDDYDPLVYDPYIDDWYAYDYDWYDYGPVYSVLSDSEIEEQIDSELWWSPFVDSDDVNVQVEDGVARLSGTVESWSERSAATENAYEGGATWVYNNLTVQ